MATCLLLPLEFVIHAPKNFSFAPTKKLSSLCVSDAYVFDNHINRLRPRQPEELYTSRNSIIHLFCALNSGEVLMANFLARALLPRAPVLKSKGLYLGSIDLNSLYSCFNINNEPLHLATTSAYRSTRQLSDITSAYDDDDYPSLTKSKWKFFWNACMLPLAQTIWWRSLHGKISCRSVLNQLLPTSFEDSLCPFSDLEIDSVTHFLFSCDSKWIVWQQVLQECLLQTVSLDIISDAIFSLTMPSWHMAHSPLSAIQLISGITVGIWRAHWLYVFSSAPFDPVTVIHSTHTILITLWQEESLLPHKPP